MYPDYFEALAGIVYGPSAEEYLEYVSQNRPADVNPPDGLIVERGLSRKGMEKAGRSERKEQGGRTFKAG